MDKARNSKTNQFFITYTSATAKVTPEPNKMAEVVNPPIFRYLKSFQTSPVNVGIVAMDFITKDISRMVYSKNFINTDKIPSYYYK